MGVLQRLRRGSYKVGTARLRASEVVTNGTHENATRGSRRFRAASPASPRDLLTTPMALPARLPRDVYVVSDHAAEHAADRRADETAFDLVATRRGAEDRTRRRANRRVTLRVLLDHDRRCRG